MAKDPLGEPLTSHSDGRKTELRIKWNLGLWVSGLVNQGREESLELLWKLIRALRMALYGHDKPMVRALQSFY